MALETGTYISDLVATNPTSADAKSQGDDHLRLIKSAIKATFPLITSAVNVTHTVLNYVANVTSDIQAQLNARGLINGQTWTGAHDFTASVIGVATQALGDISNRAASTQFAMTMQSPVFSGTPTAPTAPLGTNTTQIASTEFVTNTAFAGVTQNPTPDFILMSQGII